ncbi:MAG: S41 family peptidase [Blastocatellia bacterium]|nr:S41 family peptidase [Blastocatellia bacterium]
MNFCIYAKHLQKIFVLFLALSLLIVSLPASGRSQEINSFQRHLARRMLQNIKNDIERLFYDPNFRGIDIDMHFKRAEEQIKKAQTQGQLYGIIAQTLLELGDPNTLFVSPAAYNIIDYGWDWKMIGDKCYVTAVKPGSDAEAKGLKVGDEILRIGNFKPGKMDAWKIKYAYFIVYPQSILPIEVRKPGGQFQQLDILSQRMVSKGINADADFFSKGGKLLKELKSQVVEVNSDLMLWKLFSLSSEEKIGETMKKARGYKSLIIDLRSSRETIKHTFDNRDSQYSLNRLKEIIGYLFDRDIKMADLKKREDQKPVLAKSRGDNSFNGNLVIIVDNDTSPTSEVFARIIQLEKRGKVIGDTTNGTTRLATGYHYEGQSGPTSMTWYGIVVAERELIMSDGQSLDGVGVMPDEVVIQTAEDLANNRDPVLSHAAALLGVRLSPEKAGSLLRRPNYTLWMN